MKLLPFGCTIINTSRNNNKEADALFRHLQYIDFLALALLIAQGFLDLQEALQVDPHTCAIMKVFSIDSIAYPDS